MITNGCPYSESCFLLGSLRELNLPHIEDYCSRNYENCRYYRSHFRQKQKELTEALV